MSNLKTKEIFGNYRFKNKNVQNLKTIGRNNEIRQTRIMG